MNLFTNTALTHKERRQEMFNSSNVKNVHTFNVVNPLIEDYVERCMKPESSLLQELVQETYEHIDSPQMICGPVVSQLLKLLIKLSNAKSVLEIGTFTGYSSLSMAEGLPENGKIITCEINPKAFSIANKYFQKSPYGSKIEIRLGAALETIQTLTKETFDFCFIDADKTNYLNYYKAVFPLVKRNGLIVFDNSLRSGKVLDPNDTEGKAIDEVNQYILKDKSVTNILLTIRDGVNIVTKVW